MIQSICSDSETGKGSASTEMGLKLRNMTSIYLYRDDQILLLYRQGGRVVNNVWIGSAGGHFEPDELNDPEACILREMREELGLGPEDIEDLALRYVALRRTQGEIRQNYYYFARLKETVNKNLTSNEGICKWFSIGGMEDLKMPYTAGYVIKHYCETGRFTNNLYAGAADGETVQFIPMLEF